MGRVVYNIEQGALKIKHDPHDSAGRIDIFIDFHHYGFLPAPSVFKQDFNISREDKKRRIISTRDFYDELDKIIFERIRLN